MRITEAVKQIHCIIAHKGFTYRPCRRGKNRCSVCGCRLKPVKEKKDTAESPVETCQGEE